MRGTGNLNLSELSDEELLGFGGDLAFSELSKRYFPVVAGRAESMCGKIGVGSAELIDEGMLAVYDAARSFRADGGAMFKTYAERCIDNRLINASKRLSRILKNETSADSSIQTDGIDFESEMLGREHINELLAAASTLLSKLEYSVLTEFVGGKSYKEIALAFDIDEKAVDNAMQRARRKLRKIR